MGVELAFVTSTIEQDLQRALDAGAEEYVSLATKGWGNSNFPISGEVNLSLNKAKNAGDAARRRGFLTQVRGEMTSMKRGSYCFSIPKPWGQRVAYVRDCNGALVELCTPMG